MWLRLKTLVIPFLAIIQMVTYILNIGANHALTRDRICTPLILWYPQYLPNTSVRNIRHHYIYNKLQWLAV